MDINTEALNNIFLFFGTIFFITMIISDWIKLFKSAYSKKDKKDNEGE